MVLKKRLNDTNDKGLKTTLETFKDVVDQVELLCMGVHVP